MAGWNPYMPSWWQSALLPPPNPEDEWPVASPPPASGFEFPAAGPLPLPSTSFPDVDNPRQDFSDVMWMGLPVQPLMDKKNGWLDPNTESLFAGIRDLPGAQPPTSWPDPSTSMPNGLPPPDYFLRPNTWYQWMPSLQYPSPFLDPAPPLPSRSELTALPHPTPTTSMLDSIAKFDSTDAPSMGSTIPGSPVFGAPQPILSPDPLMPGNTPPIGDYRQSLSQPDWLTGALFSAPPSLASWPDPSLRSPPATPSAPGADGTSGVRYPWWMGSAAQPGSPPFGATQPTEWLMPPDPTLSAPASDPLSDRDTDDAWMGSMTQPLRSFGAAEPTQWPDPSSRSLSDVVGNGTGDIDTSWVDSLAYPRTPVFDAPTATQWPDPNKSASGEVAADAWDDDPFARAAARTRRSVRPEGGRQEGVLTAVLEAYLPHVMLSWADLVALPFRDPVPRPKGLQINDAGEYLINGSPAAETPEGRAWLEDQQKRRDWVPAMALAMFTLGRLPGGAPQGAIGAFAGQKGSGRISKAERDEILLKTYHDPPKTLQELQEAAQTKSVGRDRHHIVEKAAAERAGFPDAWINGPDNLASTPTMKHWEITGWFQTKDKAYDGMSPREYLQDKSWDERRKVGLDALVKHKVLKP